MQDKKNTTPGGATALWQQLQATAQVVRAVQKGKSGTAAVDGVASALRPAVQALAFHVWRHWGIANALLGQLVQKSPPPSARALLGVALALLQDGPAGPLYDAFTLVNQAVEAAKRHAETKGQASFINACLRRYLRETAQVHVAVAEDVQAVWNFPAWWVAKVQRDWPLQWEAVLQASNQQATMALRVNGRKTSRAACLAALQEAGIGASVGGDVALLLHKALPVGRLPGFAQGQLSVQDAGAQLAAPLLLNGLESSAPLRVLDACAAPGGKTGHILEMCDAKVTALDIDPQRCERIGENLARLGLQADVVAADAGTVETWWDGVPYDAVLLDAPCTASGIVRRHPDVRWLRREQDIAQLAAIQRKLLQKMWSLVRPGGRLLYCTCSIFKAEGVDQVQAFLAHNTDAVLLPSPGHLMPHNGMAITAVQDNQTHDHDGFFYALFQKQLL